MRELESLGELIISHAVENHYLMIMLCERLTQLAAQKSCSTCHEVFHTCPLVAPNVFIGTPTRAAATRSPPANFHYRHMPIGLSTIVGRK